MEAVTQSTRLRSAARSAKAPLTKQLGRLVSTLRGRSSKSGKQGQELTRAPSLGSVGSTCSGVSSDSLHSSEYSEDSREDVAALPLFEDEAAHTRWAEALGGRQPGELTLEDLRPLLSGGMPLKHRLALWPQWFALSPGDVCSVEALQGLCPEQAAAQIELDVPRAHPHWPLSDADRRSLGRVLRACAARSPEVGYCQGMGHIAAVLVALGFDEDTALRGMCSLLDTCCPGYHDSSLSGWRRDAAALEALVASVLSPQAFSRLRELDVPLSVLASDHFLTLGSRAWPLEATVRLWDLALLEGPSALFASFLALLELFLPCERELEDLQAMGPEAPEPVEVFRERALRGLADSPSSVIERAQEIIGKVPQSLLDELRRGA